MVSLRFHRRITHSPLSPIRTLVTCPPFSSKNTALTLVICSLPPRAPLGSLPLWIWGGIQALSGCAHGGYLDPWRFEREEPDGGTDS